jgi:subtilisin family serine protease
VDGIYWSASWLGGDADIINISLRSNSTNQDLYDACGWAHDGGDLLVAASGNNNHLGIDYPAAYDDRVVAVGAVYQADPRDLDPPPRWVELPYGSNYGLQLDFVAPTNVNTTTLGGGYAIFSGTSAAVPHVAGAAALVWSSPPESGFWDNDKVEQKMRATALDLGSSGRDVYFGYGLVNAWYANQRPPADITYDHWVHMPDVSFLCAHWWDGTTEGAEGFDRRADINRDNAANLFDAAAINANWNKHYP